MAAIIWERDVRVPGDKSISHRALMLGALASGRAHVRGILPSADVQSTAAVLRALGVPIPPLADAMAFEGPGLHGLRAASGPLDCGNSGTTARLMTGVLAAQPFESLLTGDPSLSRRPMQRVTEPLTAMGASFVFEGGGDHLPLRVRGGPLHEIAWTTPTASAQIKSAILLAALAGGVAVTVREPVLSRDHTERMLQALGAKVARDGHTVHLAPTDRLAPLDIDVPGDPSSAAFFAALAALRDDGSITIANVCLNPTRLGFLGALREMGAEVAFADVRDTAGEPVGDVIVRRGGSRALRGLRIDGARVPAMIDELPLLACVAARAEGETEIRGAGELRVKESDRIAAVVAGLRAVGVEADELPDGIAIRGGSRPLRGHVVTHGDHRLAMAFGILGAIPGSAITVDDPECVAVSYPGFWRDLQQLAA